MAIEPISTNKGISTYQDVTKNTVSKNTVKQENTTPEINIQGQVNPGSLQTNDEVQGSAESAASASRRMKDAIDRVNDKIALTRTKCEFSYHEETKRVSIKVIDEETDKVIREIPPEETLDMLTKMWEIAGLLVDEKR